MAPRSINKVWIKAKTAAEAKRKAQRKNTGFIATKATVVEKEYVVTLRQRKK